MKVPPGEVLQQVRSKLVHEAVARQGEDVDLDVVLRKLDDTSRDYAMNTKDLQNLRRGMDALTYKYDDDCAKSLDMFQNDHQKDILCY